MTDKDFIKQVQSEMNEYESHAITTNGDKFAIWFAHKFLDLEVGEVINKFHIGKSGDEKTDIGIVDERFPTKMIIQCKYSEDPGSKTYSKNEVDEVLTAKNRIDTAPDDGNELRRQFVKDFKGSKLPVKLIIVGFGRFIEKPHHNAYEYALNNHVQIYDFDRIKKEYIRIIDPASSKKPDSIEFPEDPQKIFEFQTVKTKVYFTLLSTDKIYNMVKETGDGIFEENLRYQLPKASVSSMISGELKETLNEKPQEFVILNNGLTFICEKVVREANKIKLIKPQLINGCQTAYAIYEAFDAFQKSQKTLKESFISAKIIETDIMDSSRIKKISRAANLQNPITPRNKYANDELQEELRSKLGNYKPAIFYDHKDGLWESVVKANKQSLYKVPNKKSSRRLDNQLVGQIYLSLLGKPQIAGNQKGIIFSEEKYYNAVFNYKLAPQERFQNIGISPNNAMLMSGEDNFIEDILFAFRIYKLLDAIELELYPKKKELYSDNPNDSNYQYYEKISVKEFVTYWHFHIIRLFHEIIYSKVSGSQKEILKVRENLVGKEIDLFFSPIKALAKKFNMESAPQKYTILDIAKPSDAFPLFGKWISNIEQIVYDVVSPEKAKPDWKGFNQFFYKRENTLTDILKKVTDVLGGADSDIKFPLGLD